MIDLYLESKKKEKKDKEKKMKKNLIKE